MNKLKHLNERDMRILKALDSYGLMSTSQIKKIFFEDTAKRTMLKRLQILNKKSFIRYTEGLPRGERTWCLTKSSSLLLGSDMYIKTLNKNTLFHDVRLNDLRHKIASTCKTSHWKSGHYLLQKASANTRPEDRFETVVPDSFFMLKTKDHLRVVALELELSKKAKYRYKRVFEKYIHKPEIHWLWYLVPTRKFGDQLLKMQPDDPGARGYGKFRWSLVDEVLESPEKAVVHSMRGSATLSELCGLKKI